MFSAERYKLYDKIINEKSWENMTKEVLKKIVSKELK